MWHASLTTWIAWGSGTGQWRLLTNWIQTYFGRSGLYHLDLHLTCLGWWDWFTKTNYQMDLSLFLQVYDWVSWISTHHAWCCGSWFWGLFTTWMTSYWAILIHTVHAWGCCTGLTWITLEWATWIHTHHSWGCATVPTGLLTPRITMELATCIHTYHAWGCCTGPRGLLATWITSDWATWMHTSHAWVRGRGQEDCLPHGLHQIGPLKCTPPKVCGTGPRRLLTTWITSECATWIPTYHVWVCPTGPTGLFTPWVTSEWATWIHTYTHSLTHYPSLDSSDIVPLDQQDF